MKKSYLLSFVFFIFYFFNFLFSQTIIEKSYTKKPNWLFKIPQGKYNTYFTGMGVSKISLEDAKEQAIADVLTGIIMQGKISATSTIKTYHEQTNSKIISRVSREITQKGKSTTIKGLKKVEEYWLILKENNEIQYHYWILMKIPKKGFDEYTTNYEEKSWTKPLLRSVIIPGWGQYYKCQKKKAFSIFSLQLLTLSAGIITSNISKDYNNKARNSIKIKDIEWYSNQSDKYFHISTLSFILSFGIYLYNIIDVLSSTPEKTYALNENYYLANFVNINPDMIIINYKIKF